MAHAHMDQSTIPTEMFRQVQAARQPCAQYKVGKCRKGIKCTRSHDTATSNELNFHLPYTSRFKMEDGRDCITLRPPIIEAGKAYFIEHRKPCVLGASRQWNSKSNMRMITYSLVDMVPPDLAACAEAESAGYAWGSEASRSAENKRHQSSAAKPAFHSHTTDLTAALSILFDGEIRPGPGIAGEGVYSFACESDQDAMALDEAWSRGAGGKYNRGAMFVFKAHGILVGQKNREWPVPPGCTAKKNDQYSSHPGVIEYMSFTTTVDGWLGQLSKQLDALGYTEKLHKALMDIKTHMETESVSTSYADVVLENRNITQKRRHVDSGQPDEDTQTPNLDDSGHDVSPPWSKGQQHLKAPDDRTEDDYRREDKRKSLKDEPWDEDDDWGESWTDDDWKREHWKSSDDAGVAKTQSDEDARYDAAVEFTK